MASNKSDSSTLNGSSLGITESGYEVVFNPYAELINRSDAYGDTLLDFVWRGCDVSIILNGLEYGVAGMQTAFWPWNATLGNMGVIGRLGSAIASSLVLTSTAGTPAVSSPATLTATRTVLAPGSSVNLLFTSQLRKVPIKFNCLPSDSAITFSTT